MEKLTPQMKAALKEARRVEAITVPDMVDKFGRPVRFMQKKVIVMGGGKPKVEVTNFINPNKPNRAERRRAEHFERRDGAPSKKTEGAFGKSKLSRV